MSSTPHNTHCFTIRATNVTAPHTAPYTAPTVVQYEKREQQTQPLLLHSPIRQRVFAETVSEPTLQRVDDVRVWRLGDDVSARKNIDSDWVLAMTLVLARIMIVACVLPLVASVQGDNDSGLGVAVSG